MTYQECLDWLFGQLPMYQRVGGAAYKADLSNTLLLMEILGHPENKFKSVHVAGTNGKGSVSHMFAAIFQKAGYKTGLYTSPHLKDFRERIRINGEMIPEDKVVNFVDQHKEHFTSLGLSFFEMTVGMAFQYFADEQVDIAIVEVGMGGRLDSTNVVNPELSIITNISLDHTQFLGNTKALIAAEKGGIIKPGISVVVGERDEESSPVFEEIAKTRNSPISFAEDIIPWRAVDALDLKGMYQERNVRTVLAAVKVLLEQGHNLHIHLEEALNNTARLTGLRGRWEQIGSKPKIICDTGHNEAGVQMVLDQIKRESYRQLHIVWGMVGDKDISTILRMLPKHAIYYFCKPDIPRGKNAEELGREAVRFGLSGKSYPSVTKALEAARSHTLSDDLIFVGGSTFVVGEAI
jgi:dihydrofolate synthase/folylpolyglutamate synthase